MDRRLIKEILAAHADQIVRTDRTGHEVRELFPEEEELVPLLDVAEQVKTWLKPAQPSADFEENLRRDLMVAAHLRRASQNADPDGARREFIFSALALAVVALVVSVVIARRRATYHPVIT
jgi:urease gamma subunit